MKISPMLPWLRTAVVASRMASEMSSPPPMPRANVCTIVSSSLWAAIAALAAAPGSAHTALSMPHLPRAAAQRQRHDDQALPGSAHHSICLARLMYLMYLM